MSSVLAAPDCPIAGEPPASATSIRSGRDLRIELLLFNFNQEACCRPQIHAQFLTEWMLSYACFDERRQIDRDSETNPRGVHDGGFRADDLRQQAECIYNVDNVARYLGTFEQAVLLALVRPQTSLGKEAYGRAVLKEVQHRLQRDVAAGAVYATLERLEAKGLISSRLTAATAVRGGRTKGT